jgi:predicted transcriptional regulator
MSIVEKQFHISDHMAKRLEQLARDRGITESALMEEGLDLLFKELASRNTTDESLRPDWEWLQQWEKEHGKLQTDEPALTIRPEDIVSVVGTTVDPARVRRIGEEH